MHGLTARDQSGTLLTATDSIYIVSSLACQSLLLLKLNDSKLFGRNGNGKRQKYCSFQGDEKNSDGKKFPEEASIGTFFKPRTS